MALIEAGTRPCRVTRIVLVSSPLLSLPSVFPLLPFLIALSTCHEMSVFQPTFIECHYMCALGGESMSIGRPVHQELPANPHLHGSSFETGCSTWGFLALCGSHGSAPSFLKPGLATTLNFFFCGLLTPTKVVFPVVFCFCFTLLLAIVLQVFLRLHVTSCF